MNIIQSDNINVKNEADVFSPAEKDRATLGSDPSVFVGSSGEKALAVFMSGNNTSVESLCDKPTVISPDTEYLDKSLDVQNSETVPTGLDGSNSTNCDSVDITGICKDFDNYIKQLEDSQKLFAHIKNEKDGLEALCMIDRVSGSRYFPEGRAKIRRKIQKRIKKQKERGIYLVFTVDTKKYSQVEAWDNIWENFKLWRDAINVYRERHMDAKGCLRYVAVLEQHKSGYPHLNVFFPGLRVLIKRDDFYKLNEWWKMGNVEAQRERKPESACSYVLKYISKLEGWSKECFAILWHYRIRLWNMSFNFYDDKKPSGWVLVDIYKSISLKYLAIHFGIEADNLQDERFVLVNSP